VKHHLIFGGRTSGDDLVLDDLTSQSWSRAPYSWVRMQTPNYGVSLSGGNV
jgi:predicted transglutaminase-like cysteine proteinase